MKVYVTECMAEARADEVCAFLSYRDVLRYIGKTLHERKGEIHEENTINRYCLHYSVHTTIKKENSFEYNATYEYWFHIYECEVEGEGGTKWLRQFRKIIKSQSGNEVLDAIRQVRASQNSISIAQF